MRWTELFDDMAAQLVHEERLALEQEVADRRLRDTAEVVLVHRLAATPSDVSLQLLDGSWRTGTWAGSGDGWVVLAQAGAAGRQVLVPLSAVGLVRGVGARSAPGLPPAARRPLVLALRGLGAADLPVLVTTRSATVRGTLGRVGADHVDVEVPAAARGARRDVVTVPFGALLAVEEGPG
ncbi:hypothetical protein GTR02_20135 [Kineococcus sp. R8]|uniref:hypothetical protein n=1 Tax=Kineococcus siccus TaxID=2696567 RepID=UPI0014136287|nr:hypothetical protein [Kineococcus siccus]NAZ84121.1 hypothetical protein [Kineococcus siccus]